MEEKSTLVSPRLLCRSNRRPSGRRALDLLTVGLVALALGACATSTSLRLPEVDLETAGWTVWTGQALWQPGGERPALAGELLAARHVDGDVFVSFSKPPVPIFTARIAGGKWSLDFVERGRSYGGGGKPPGRFVWFRLPDFLEGAAAPKAWDLERPAEDELTLVHRRRGERIRLVLDP